MVESWIAPITEISSVHHLPVAMSTRINDLQTIDDVLAELDQVIHWARNEHDRLGFFAVLYRNVTIKVKEGIAAGLFEDGPRMEKLDVTFATRYLTALDSFRRGAPLSRCWFVCFRLAAQWRPIILQQLLVGMNAHINFDLGIAAQAVAPGEELVTLKKDFDVINEILGGMIVKVQSNVEEVSPWIKFLDRIDPSGEGAIINFSLNKARASAWLVANLVNSTPPEDLGRKLTILDDGVAILGSLICNPPGWLLRGGLYLIRLRESNDIPQVIDVLSQT
jgi:hypothetical protein